MSTIYNQVVTTFRAQGGNVVSQLNAYGAGFGRLGQSINENVNMSSRLNNQWRAIGTTIRYAIAGTAVFGLSRMVGQLRDVNNQLGLMSAIGSTQTGAPFSFQQITDLGNRLQDAAVNSITPVNEMNDAAINLLSTVQNVPRSQLPGMLQEIAQGAKLTQTPVEDLTQAATTMNIAFGRANNLRNISQFTRMWFALIQSAPGGISAAPTIAQAMPGLASMFQLAPGHGVPGGMGQAQMMALTLGVLRTGMPAATGMRGLTYLIQSLAQPTGGAKTALAGIGITPEFVSQRGVYAAVMRLLHFIGPTSSRTAHRLGALDDTALPDTASSDVSSLPGVAPDKLGALRQMVPRIHGVRAAVILSSQLQAHGTVRSLDQNLQDLTAAEDNHARAAQDMNKAWQRANQRMKLQQAQVAINTMGLQVAQMFEPILNFVAKGPIDLSHLMRGHRGAATIAGRTFVGAMTGIGLARMLGVGRLPGIRNIPGLRAILGGGMDVVPRGMAAMAAVTGNPGILGATPQNPLYVSVINDLFGGVTPTPTPHGGGGGAFGFLKRAAGWTGVAALARYGGAIPSLLGKAGSAIEGAGAEIPGVADWRMWWPGAMNPQTHRRNPGWENLVSLGLVNPENIRHLQQIHHARQALGGNIVDVQGLNKAMWHGQVDMNMVITREHADGTKTRQRVHVPVDVWAKGRHPSHRGQAGKTVRTR